MVVGRFGVAVDKDDPLAVPGGENSEISGYKRLPRSPFAGGNGQGEGQLMASANEALVHQGECSAQGKLNDITHTRGFLLEEDVDAHLAKAQERATAHPGHHQMSNALRGQQLHRPEAPALDVRRVIEDGHLTDVAPRCAYKGEAVALAEVARPLTLQPSLAYGRYRQQHLLRHFLSSPMEGASDSC
jgi:hypothetical protein